MSRLTNYIFVFVLVYLFILEANADQHSRIFIALSLSIIFSYIALMFNWLSLDGARAASVFGIIALGIGGWLIALSVLIFFISSSLLSTGLIRDEKNYGISSGKLISRRTGNQVWSNGFFLALFCILWFLTEQNLYLIAAFSAVATATADTWATELGSKTKGNTWLITNFSKVDPGTDGGISLKGIIASVMGSFLIAITYILVTPEHWNMFYIIFISGFLGSVADSYLGAILQYNKSGSFYNYMKRIIPEGESNNSVNLIATGIGSLTALILIIWI